VPREKGKPFLVVLTVILFMSLGVAGLLLALPMFTAELTGEAWLLLLSSVFVSVAFMATAYGLYKGSRWAWAIGFALAVLSMMANVIYGYHLALTVDAILIVLLLATAKHYDIKILGKAKIPSVIPPASKPIATILPHKEYKFIRRKR